MTSPFYSMLNPLTQETLPKGWRVSVVADIKAEEKSSCVAGPFGSDISSKYFADEGVPIIRGSNLRDDLTQFVPRGFVFVTQDRAKKYKAQHVRSGDLVFTCWGTVGQVGLIPEDGPFPEYIISNKQLKLRPNLSITDPKFLFYWFACPMMVEHVKGKAIGAAVPGINLGILKALPVVLPPLPTQRRIAGILSAYDELIANNQRRIAVLEQMARALYREWFVYFRAPGVRIQPGSLLPEGWEVKRLDDIADSVRSSVAKGELDEEVPYLGLEHIPRRSLALDAWVYSRDLGSSKLLFKKGDVLFGKIRPYFHKVSVAPFDGLCSSDTIVIRAKTDRYHALATCCASSDEFVAHATATSNGSKMPRADWKVLRDYPVAVPPPELLSKFSAFVDNTIEQMQTLVFQTANLRRTRDLLLPRLMSGRVELNNVDA